jgi:hypothetical protein
MAENDAPETTVIGGDEWLREQLTAATRAVGQVLRLHSNAETGHNKNLHEEFRRAETRAMELTGPLRDHHTRIDELSQLDSQLGHLARTWFEQKTATEQIRRHEQASRDLEATIADWNKMSAGTVPVGGRRHVLLGLVLPWQSLSNARESGGDASD